MIRLLIVQDDSILSAGLRMMLSSAGGIEVAGETTEDQAAALAAAVDPQVVLVDADLCQAAGLAAVKELHARCPHLGIVVLGLHDDPDTRLEAMRAGASIFVPKEAPEKMLEAIRELGRPR